MPSFFHIDKWRYIDIIKKAPCECKTIFGRGVGAMESEARCDPEVERSESRRKT